MHRFGCPRFRRLLLGLAFSAGMCLSAVSPWGCVPPPGGQNGNSGLTGKYVGAQRCVNCHVEKHAAWSQTSHAKALETLEADGRGTDFDCIGCHTVGHGDPGGFVDRATTNALAGVQCENCHGPGRDHAENPNNLSLRPAKDIAGTVCGKCHVGCQCHRGTTHPNFQLWHSSKHGSVTDSVAVLFADGQSLNACGLCHSGDFRLRAVIGGETVADDLLEGKSTSDMNAVTCAICHDPHSRTNNATNPVSNWDYQLRYPDVASPTPSNSIAETIDASRFNLCGQCHHGMGRTWQTTDEPPKSGVQANVYIGEMPMPVGQEGNPLVSNKASVHADVPIQCTTCHMFPKDSVAGSSQTTEGHTFKSGTDGCSAADCHASPNVAMGLKTSLQEEVQGKLDDVAARLDNAGAWEYTSQGGPDQAGQAGIPDEVKKIRFLYHYVIADGSLGVHNPEYIRDILAEADRLLTSMSW